METPLHHHPNDGGYYPKCKRCQMNEAAPDLAEALQTVLSAMRAEFQAHKLTTCKTSAWLLSQRQAEKALVSAGIII